MFKSFKCIGAKAPANQRFHLFIVIAENLQQHFRFFTFPVKFVPQGIGGDLFFAVQQAGMDTFQLGQDTV